jgi:hypothetical protein
MSAGRKPNAGVIGFYVIFASNVFAAVLLVKRSQCLQSIAFGGKSKFARAANCQLGVNSCLCFDDVDDSLHCGESLSLVVFVASVIHSSAESVSAFCRSVNTQAAIFLEIILRSCRSLCFCCSAGCRRG